MPHLSDWKIKQVLFGQALNEIEESFSLRGFYYMPIKGAYLIVSGLAAAIANRTIRDIDLLIAEEQFDEVCRWFSSLENVDEIPNYWDFERSFIYRMGTSFIYVEFHNLINFPARFLLPNRDLFLRGIQTDKSYILPDPIDALLIHICHMLPHVVDGFNKQAIREVTLYAQQGGFNWNTFWTRAEKTGIGQFIHLVIATVQCTEGTLTQQQTTGCSLYVQFMVRTNLFTSLRNRILRKVLFEIPFVRSFTTLLHYNITHRFKNNSAVEQQ